MPRPSFHFILGRDFARNFILIEQLRLRSETTTDPLSVFEEEGYALLKRRIIATSSQDFTLTKEERAQFNDGVSDAFGVLLYATNRCTE